MSNGEGFAPSPRIGSTYQNQTIVISGPYVSHQCGCIRIGALTFSTMRLMKVRVLGVEMRVRSVSGDSFISPSLRPPEEMGSRQQLTVSTSSNIWPSLPTTTQPPITHPQPAPLTTKKPLRAPKLVIMQPAYKRYLIAMLPSMLVFHLKQFRPITKTHLISSSHGSKEPDNYVTFSEYTPFDAFLAPRKEDYGLGKRRMDRVDGEKEGKV